MSDIQYALVGLFASSAVCAFLKSTASPMNLILLGYPRALIEGTFLAAGLLFQLSMAAAVILSFIYAPWWTAFITFFGGGMVGGAAAAFLRRLPLPISVLIFVGCWAWLIYDIVHLSH